MEAALARRLLPFGSSKFDCFEFSLLEFGCFAFGCFVLGCFEFTLQISTMHDKNYNVGYVITITTQCRTGTVGLMIRKSAMQKNHDTKCLECRTNDWCGTLVIMHFRRSSLNPVRPRIRSHFDCRNTMYNVGRFVHSLRTVLHNTMQGQ